MTEIREVTDADVEAIEDDIGSGHGAWDMIRPHDIIRCAWKRFLAPAVSPSPAGGEPRYDIGVAGTAFDDAIKELVDAGLAIETDGVVEDRTGMESASNRPVFEPGSEERGENSPVSSATTSVSPSDSGGCEECSCDESPQMVYAATLADLRAQLAEAREEGVGFAYLHPREGWIAPVATEDTLADLRAQLAEARERAEKDAKDARRWRTWVQSLPARQEVYIGGECSRYTITLDGKMTIPEWVDDTIAFIDSNRAARASVSPGRTDTNREKGDG